MVDTHLMPKFDPPFKAREVRDLYRAGTWAYALGRPAWTHPKYRQAVQRAQRGKHSFNPWWIRAWNDVEATLAGCWMDEKRGRDAADFFTLLRHFEGEWAGKPFVLADWQVYDITIPVFGWTRPDGTRRFRKAYVEVTKKNGKTTWSGGVVLLLTMADGEAGAEVYTAAVDRQQSGKMFRQAHMIGINSQAIKDKLEFVPSRHRIVYHPTASFYQALSSKASSAHGLNVHGLAVDESHVFPNRELYDALWHGGRARRQPLFWILTTAGIYDPTSLGWQLHQYGNMVREGEAYTDWSYFAYMCGLTAAEEPTWYDPAMCIKATPSIGLTIKLEDDQEEAQRALNDPSEINNQKRLTRNIWTQQINAWMNMQDWEACAGEYGESDLAGQTCYGGLDCSLSEDITGFTLWFPPQRGYEKHRFLCWAWCPEDGIPKFDEQYNGLYSQWVRSGHLIATPGSTIRQDYIRAKINELGQKFAIRTIGYDKAFAENLCNVQLVEDGFDTGPFNQGAPSMTEPVQFLMTLVKNGEIEHPNHPVANWHFSNCQLAKDGGDRCWLVKNWGASGTGKAKVRFKIDLAVASVMALGTSLLDPYPVDQEMEVVWL